jgi:hypothetical protein
VRCIFLNREAQKKKNETKKEKEKEKEKNVRCVVRRGDQEPRVRGRARHFC